MNLELASRIREAINDTVSSLRPAPGFPEPTRTALQTHLDALLKEEMRALTGQAPEGNLVAEYVQAELGRVKGALQRDDALGRAWVDPRKDSEPTPWYPDDSGEWLEVADVCTCRPFLLGENAEVNYMYQGERERRSVNLVADLACGLNWSEKPGSEYRIVAYKVVKP